MSARENGPIRRNFFVDQARHPLLHRWMIDNPYYWSEAARDVLESELASGRMALNLQGGTAARTPMRPRGVNAIAPGKDRQEPSQPAPVVQGPDSGSPSAGARAHRQTADTPQSSTPSAHNNNKDAQENSYSTEPAPPKAAPVDPEPAEAP